MNATFFLLNEKTIAELNKHLFSIFVIFSGSDYLIEIFNF